MTYRVLVVCTGNICRSPTAEVILRKAFSDAGVTDVSVESAGLSDETTGESMDLRALKALVANGYPAKTTHLARRIASREISDYDLVLPMTANQLSTLRWSVPDPVTRSKIVLFRSLDPALKESDASQDVADPYNGGADGFENCIRQIESAIPGIVDFVKSAKLAE